MLPHPEEMFGAKEHGGDLLLSELSDYLRAPSPFGQSQHQIRVVKDLGLRHTWCQVYGVVHAVLGNLDALNGFSGSQ